MDGSLDYLDMKWASPLYTDRTIYNKAAKSLLDENTSDEDFNRAADIVSNWRASHSYPLHAITMSLRLRANKVSQKSIVVQRLKRLASILPKLKKMRLTQIQDIGGCRVVLSDMTDLNKLHEKYKAAAGKQDKRRPYMDGEPNDYIANPKEDGYRGIHYVFRYRSEQDEYAAFNEMKIEVQLRTRAQHTWATAVEIVDLFTGENLKSDIERKVADPDWKRFFALMGSVIATNEDCKIVPNTPTSKAKIVKELKGVCTNLDAITKFEGYGRALEHIHTAGTAKGGAYLIKVDTESRNLSVKPYLAKDRKNLEKDYIDAETENLKNRHIQIAQVNARSFDEFKRAYPNYVLDTSVFVQTIRNAINA